MASSRSQLPLGAVRTETGEVIVPASQRADGSVRKPIRIRQGYVPQDEVPKYKTVAQRRREQEVQQQQQQQAATSSASAASPSPPRQPQTQQRVPSRGAEALSLESLTLESKTADKPSSTTTAAGASARPLTGAQAHRADDADRPRSYSHSSASELKQELSKLNRLLKDIEKLEARAHDGELSPPLQRKVARKHEVQTRRSAIIAELNGAVSTSTSASSSPSTATTTKKKKAFVAIEL